MQFLSQSRLGLRPCLDLLAGTPPCISKAQCLEQTDYPALALFARSHCPPRLHVLQGASVEVKMTTPVALNARVVLAIPHAIAEAVAPETHQSPAVIEGVQPHMGVEGSSGQVLETSGAPTHLNLAVDTRQNGRALPLDNVKQLAIEL